MTEYSSDRVGVDRTGADDPTGSDLSDPRLPASARAASELPGSARAAQDVPGSARAASDRAGSARGGDDETGSTRAASDRAGTEPSGAGPSGAGTGDTAGDAIPGAGGGRSEDGFPDAGEPLTEGETDLVVVTGLSGGGRSTVARALENVGYYVVDNLPQALMLDMAQLAFEAGGAARRTAMVLDVRSRAFSTDLAGAVHALRDRGFSPRVVFVDADDEVLIRRFESVRRSHPLQGDGRLADGIAAERKLLEEAREQADVIIDTSHLNVNQLRRRVEELFGGEDARKLRITVLSFGFKYGLPPDADYVMDARFLPNPFWVPDLREHTGLEESVSGYVLGQEGAADFVSTYASLIAATAPGFEREGKRYLTVAIGCTGGKHRSVAIAEELTNRLREIRLSAHASHRDLGRE